MYVLKIDMKSLYVTGSLSIESKTHAMLLLTSTAIQIQWLLHGFNHRIR